MLDSMYAFYCGMAKAARERREIAMEVWYELNQDFGGARSRHDEFVSGVMMTIAVDERQREIDRSLYAVKWVYTHCSWEGKV